LEDFSSETSILSTLAAAGPFLQYSRNSFTSFSSPSTKIPTESSGLFLTHPTKLNLSATVLTKYLKPTP